MGKQTLNRHYLQKLSKVTGFKDNGDVDLQNSVLYVDENDNVIAAIVVGNITNVPVLGKALPDSVKDENGSAQILLLYMDSASSYGYLYDLLREFLGHLLPFKVLWSHNGEYTSEILLKRLGFQYHINGVSQTYYMLIN